MTTALSKLKRILSSRWASFIMVLFALSGRLVQLIYFFNLRVDASYQSIATKNLVNGHGISLDTVTTADLSTIIYSPLIKWPPGFSWLLAPFYILSRENYMVAGILLHSLCAVMLIFFSRAILRLFETPTYLINTYTFLSGFFIYSFYFIISSDAITTCFFVGGMYYTLSLIKSEEDLAKKITILSACLLICGWTKYLLIPVIFVVPLYLIAKGFFCGQRKLKNGGILAFFIVSIGISSVLIYQKAVSGSATYISQTQHGLFPKNLLVLYPVFPSAFINPDTLGLLWNRLPIRNLLFTALRLVYLLMMVPATIELLRFFKTLSQKISLRRSFLFLLVFVAFSLVGVLVLLSLSLAKEEESPGKWWTYVQEARYYGPLVVLMQLFLFVLYPVRLNRFKKIRAVFYLLLFLISMESLRGMVFDFNRVRFFGKEKYSWQQEDRFQRYADRIINDQKKKFPAKQTVIAGSSYYMNNRVCLYSHAPILAQDDAINHLSSLQTKEPVLLLIMLDQESLSKYGSFLSSGPALAGQFNQFYFYAVYVQPH